MFARWRCALCCVALLFVCGARLTAAEPKTVFTFRDVAEESGVRALTKDMQAHAAAWGDADGDGQLDLYVGTFHKPGTAMNRLLLQRKGKFIDAGQPALNISARSSGSVFADFDNDGDNDFYLSNLGGGGEGSSATDSKFFRNDGGTFVDISTASGTCPKGFRGRSAAAVDFNGDSLLDLVIGESLAYGSAKHSRLLLNKGELKFEDATEKVGLPKMPALGVAAGDLNLDSWPDLVFVAADGGNRVFLNQKGKSVREEEATSKVLQAGWKYTTGDDTTCGICIGDINRDGLPDMVIGHHFKTPWQTPTPVQVYLQSPAKDKSSCAFVNATEDLGLPALSMKAPHVELQDFDNDGALDLYVSMVKYVDGKPYPLIFRGQRDCGNGVHFSEDMLGLNDYPTEADRAIKSSGEFFSKVLKERKIIYTAAAPTADFDRDGRMDIFLSSWWVESPAMLLKNETKGGNWLQIACDLPPGSKLNRQGIGARIQAIPVDSEKTTTPPQGEIAVGYGYSSGQEAMLHLGLGEAKKVDLVITWPGERGSLQMKNVTANQRLTIKKEKE